MIWRIAVRNLLQHKTKTIIIGTLIWLGMTMTLVFNSLLDSLVDAISATFISNYTGDILITSSEMTGGGGVFGTSSENMMEPPMVPLLKDYEQVKAKLREIDGIKAYTSQLSCYAMLNLEEKGLDYSLFFGIDPDDYFTTMNGAQIVEGMGRRLQSGEEGLMLHYNTWERIKKDRNLELKIGDTIQLNSFGSAGFKIREVPLVGVFKFDFGNERLFTPSFMDIRSLRYLAGRHGGVIEKVEVNEDATALLDSDLDALFADESIVIQKSATPSAADDIGKIFTKPKDQSVPAADSGSWNFIVIRLQDRQKTAEIITTLNKTFESEEINAAAQDWVISAAPDSVLYQGIQLILNFVIIVLSIVAMIIIMNTLVVSVMERTSEIGTMRALGAQKSFVVRIFIAETTFITLVFGVLGFLTGFITITVLHVIGIPTADSFLSFLGGGLVIKPFIGVGPVIITITLMVMIGLASWIFPVFMALKVTPLKAISTE